MTITFPAEKGRTYLLCTKYGKVFSTPTYRAMHDMKETCPLCGGKVGPLTEENIPIQSVD